MQLGVCYYPEHWPESWWSEDARQMVELGIRQVRIGEFAWSRIEPTPGQFEWDWLDRAIETLHAAGLDIVLCTPTATPPKWLIDAHPTILAVDAEGRPRRFGSRRHYDFSSDVYLSQALRITEAIAERYGQHPAVKAWQVDNEYGCHDTVLSYSPCAAARFRQWLARRYRDIAALNEAWGTVFWSQEYRSFDEIDLPAGTVTEAHPAHRLDHRRFASDEVVRFNRTMCEALRALSPGRAVAHNFMLFFTEFDHHQLAKDLDVVAWDSYPLGGLENFWFDDAVKRRWLRTGHPDFAAFHHDLYRPMSKRPFWVMEQQPGAVNWGRWNPAPAPGMVRLWTWEAFAHGAEVVSYFRWRQAPFAQEQMHAGLQTPDRSFTSTAAEVASVAAELERLKPAEAAPAAVALVLDYESLWALQIQPHGADESGLEVAFECYSSLRSLGLDIDIVGPESVLAPYRLVVLPAQAIITPALRDALLASQAQVVIYPRGGARTTTFRTATGPDDALNTLLGLRVEAVESLRPGHHEPVSWKGVPCTATRWREHLAIGDGMEVLARFDDERPAVVRRGRFHYIATRLDPQAQACVLESAALAAGLRTTWLPEGIRLRRTKDALFVFNYNSVPVQTDLDMDHWVIGGPEVAPQGVSVGVGLKGAPSEI